MINATTICTFVSFQRGEFTNRDNGEVIQYYRLWVMEDGADAPTFYKADSKLANNPELVSSNLGCVCTVTLEARRFGQNTDLRAVGVQF